MNREEAIQRLKTTDACDSELCEALEMAIKALEQEPCGDCISREETLKALMDEWTEYDSELIGWLFEKIDKLPSVTAQPKVGRWIVLKDEYDDVCEAVCSCCDKNGNHKWAFCPNCGVKMSEVKE